ncbi:MAG: rhodanese-like domain-containing protein [Lachnospiraceae bacterium]|nr:rhodanese-like domain-containing protein [Lachnospiraceae bacterium]
MKKKLALTMALMLVTGALAACGGGSGGSSGGAASSAAPAEQSTAAAASTEEAAPAGNALEDAAMNYFNNFPWGEIGNNQISPADLFAKIDAGEDILIIDVRQADAYGESHLKGAVNIPYQEIPANLDKIPDDKTVFVNCYTGQTSSQTVALLNIAGKYAINIQSGWNRGISQADGFEAYTETDANELPGGSYPVDASIASAITDYYKEADGHNYKYFNFPVDDLKALVDAESDEYTILSVRQAEDYAKGHIAGAMNIPFGKGMQESFSEIPTDKPVIVYCYTGQTASQVMAVLRMLGYEAYNLNGGMGKEDGFGWLENGYPVVTD